MSRDMTIRPLPEAQQGVASSATQRPVARAWWQASARYWACLLVLGLSAVSMRTVAWKLGVVLRKEALPLKRALQLFDARKLAPDYQLNNERTDRLEPMTEEMIETLGTRDYLQVFLSDTHKGEDDPTRDALLFVTYYTGKPDMVPHEPDVCWRAAGYERASAAVDRVRVHGIGAPGDELPVRVLEFRAGRSEEFSTRGPDTLTVMYFFLANGHYALTRNDVRESLLNPFQRTAYYAKVEITFSSGGSVRAGKEESMAALGPLLERLMPVLLNDHFRLDRNGSAGQPAGDGAS